MLGRSRGEESSTLRRTRRGMEGTCRGWRTSSSLWLIHEKEWVALDSGLGRWLLTAMDVSVSPACLLAMHCVAVAAQ